jgi:hypothetical protein
MTSHIIQDRWASSLKCAMPLSDKIVDPFVLTIHYLKLHQPYRENKLPAPTFQIETIDIKSCELDVSEPMELK